MSSPNSGSSERSADRWTAAGVALLSLACLVPVVFYLTAELGAAEHLGFPLDDSWIHLQFARNLAQGDGLSFQPGKLVTGSTAPLWTALLSLIFLLPGNPVVWSKAIGVVLHFLAVAASYRLARELDLQRGLATVAALLTATASWLVWGALSGMEIPLFCVLSLWGMILAVRERRRRDAAPLSFGVLGLASLARPEGLLLLLLALVDRLLACRRLPGGGLRSLPLQPRHLATGLGLAALAAAPTLLLYQVVGGSMFPSTYGVKVPSQFGLLPSGRYVFQVLGVLFRAQPVALLLAGAGVVALISRLGTARDRGLLPALWLLSLPLAYGMLYAFSPTPVLGNFGRYFFPLLPVVAVLAAVGLEPAWQALARGWTTARGRLPLVPLLAFAVVAPGLFGLGSGSLLYAQSVRNVEDSDVALAHWMRRHLPPEATVAVMDIGAIGFLAPQRLIDLVGLVTPELARRARAAQEAGEPGGISGIRSYLEEQRPDFLMVYRGRLEGLTRDTEAFRPVHRHRIPDNVTMASDEIVVYVASWSPYFQPTSSRSAPQVPASQVPRASGEPAR